MLSEVDRVKRRWEKEDSREIETAINALLAAPNGQRFLWWLLGIGKVGAQPFTSEALATAFACGELNVGNQIQARLMETNPEAYTKMQQRMLEDARSRDTELGNASDLDTAGRSAESDRWGAGDDGTRYTAD